MPLRSDPRLAARLFGAAETVRTGTGGGLMPFLTPLLARAQETARTALGTAGYQAGYQAEFEAEFEAGKRMSRGSAIGLALGEPAPVADTATTHHSASSPNRR